MLIMLAKLAWYSPSFQGGGPGTAGFALRRPMAIHFFCRRCPGDQLFSKRMNYYFDS